eukprot:CAMPEP_0173109502 /NCGR_PEP_ID=MMETSP1102-20130122/43548_1 /TAXON_ID=49646 /ORGANISM="Geminigera sp., Strain Caron Lab Isolate" /LENGTH=285 /DNA_ID=CAMNT_0014008569 /DNA_START=124 /DNA_END=981 /DNA_ORIENTATION=-
MVNKLREEKLAQEKLQRENAKRRITGCLDPVTQQLSAFDSTANLIERIDVIYRRLDSDESGGLNFEEFRRGIKHLPGPGGSWLRVHITENDFERLTEHGKHLSPAGELTQLKFRDMMQREFWRYTQRCLTNSLIESQSKEFKSTVLMLKMLEARLEARILQDKLNPAAESCPTPQHAAKSESLSASSIPSHENPKNDVQGELKLGEKRWGADVEKVCERAVASAVSGFQHNLSRQIAEQVLQQLASFEIGSSGSDTRSDATHTHTILSHSHTHTVNLVPGSVADI